MGFENFPHQQVQGNTISEHIHPLDILPSLSEERREDVLEIVSVCSDCVGRYLKQLNITPPPQENFFLYENSDTQPLGMYEPARHAFGVQECALYAPQILIHEMIHCVSGKKSDQAWGFEYQKSVNDSSVTFYTAINEGITDLISQDIYSRNYKKLKGFFAGRGGLDFTQSGYSEETILVQKLIYYKSLLVSREQHIPEDEAHMQVWNDLKYGYFTNNYAYLEELFTVFTQEKREMQKTLVFMQSLKPTDAHKKYFEVLIKILDKKIVSLRA